MPQSVTLPQAVVEQLLSAWKTSRYGKPQHHIAMLQAMNELSTALEAPKPPMTRLTHNEITQLIVPGDYLTADGLTQFARSVENALRAKDQRVG